MAQKRAARRIKARVEFVGLKDSDEAPQLAIRLVDGAGKTIETAPITAAGAFEISDAQLKKAERVFVGPAEADPDSEDKGVFRQYSADRFMTAIESGALPLAEAAWKKWIFWFRCVSGSVRRCYPKPWIVDTLVARSELARFAPSAQLSSSVLAERLGTMSPAASAATLPSISLWPWRCSPVCHGVVEVYRRRCCCPPIVIYDPRIPEIIEWLEDPPFPEPFPEPDPPFPIPFPEPGPDPVPWERLDRLFTAGALDTVKANAGRDLVALKQLAPVEQVAYLNARPYLWCSCGTPTKVADGTIQDDGTFSICWQEPPFLSPSWCHDEFAYVVKQPRFGTLVTIYNGVAANQWFHAGDNPTLSSYSPFAIGCKEPVVPGEGAFVVLQDLGDTESHRLATPNQDGVFSVGSPLYNSGLLDPVANAADAIGKNKNRNLGGTVRLRYEFTDGMAGLGAVYYRVSVAAADNAGDPIGAFAPLPVPQWKYWDISTGDDGTHSLGPVTAGGESNLYVIPFDGLAPLSANDEWHDGQYHAVLDTSARPEGRYLVTIEVFDAAGNRLRPTGATGAGTDKAFSFRRWVAPGTTIPVPYAALTHMLWWDNRKAEAKIVDIRKNGSASSAQCQFLVGTALDTVSVGYRAYHPKPDTIQPGFILAHSLTLRRGLAGPSWNIAMDTGVNVGGPGAVPPYQSQAKTFADLLAPPPAGLTKCAFSLVLDVVTKTTNGEGHSTVFDARDPAAFAAEVTP